jgi:hypothetical protein
MQVRGPSPGYRDGLHSSVRQLRRPTRARVGVRRSWRNASGGSRTGVPKCTPPSSITVSPLPTGRCSRDDRRTPKAGLVGTFGGCCCAFATHGFALNSRWRGRPPAWSPSPGRHGRHLRTLTTNSSEDSSTSYATSVRFLKVVVLIPGRTSSRPHPQAGTARSRRCAR